MAQCMLDAMSKITATKQIRKQFGEYQKPLRCLPHNVKLCKYCGGEMLVADGSIQVFHKECRTKGRKFYGNSNIQSK